MKYIETYNTLAEHDSATFNGYPHVSRILSDNSIIYDGMHSPINYQPLVITTTEKSFLLPSFDIYAGRDSKVTEVAILANIANQTTNVRFVNTQISEPWKKREGWGLWRESGYFAPKPIDETWFKSTTTLSNYAGSIYWFVVDSFGNFKIYAGTSGDTAPTGSPVYTYNNKSSVSSSYQLTTNDVRFFGIGGDSNSAVKNSTIYRVNINDGNATYTGDYVPIVDGGTQYMLNTTTNNRYLINSY